MDTDAALPAHYRRAVFAVIRFAVAMAVVGLLVGIAFQESAKKLTWDLAGPGLHLEGIFTLSLVHGHVFVTTVVLPLALLGALVMARHAGGRPVGPGPLAWLVRGYLPFAVAAVALQLLKGYHVLLALRGGQTDLAAVDAAFLGGSHALRYGVYGFVHGGLGLTLTVFLVALWRSLRPGDPDGRNPA